MPDAEQIPDSAEGRIAALAGIVGVLLLAAPVAPPQAAIFGFLAILSVGIVVVWGYRVIVTQLAAAGTNESDNDRPHDPVEEAQKQYLHGELDESELESELEEVLDE